MEDFRLFLDRNKQDILECMEKTRISKSLNPWASFEESQALVGFLKFEEAIDVMTAFITSNPDLKRLQEGESLRNQTARFEKAFAVFFQRYLEVPKGLTVETVRTEKSYEL